MSAFIYQILIKYRLYCFCRTSGRKGRKPKIDDEAAHPALYLNVPTSSEDVEAAEQTLVGNTKRRLYNSKFPDVLLPSSETVTLLFQVCI